MEQLGPRQRCHSAQANTKNPNIVKPSTIQFAHFRNRARRSAEGSLASMGSPVAGR